MEPTWWKEGTSYHRSSSDFLKCTVAHASPHTETHRTANKSRIQPFKKIKSSTAGTAWPKSHVTPTVSPASAPSADRSHCHTQYRKHLTKALNFRLVHTGNGLPAALPPSSQISAPSWCYSIRSWVLCSLSPSSASHT